MRLPAYIFIFLLSLMAIHACKNARSENTVVNDRAGSVEDMILIPAGEAHIGNSNGFEGEQPEFTTYIDAFYLDKHEITVAQFRKFIQETGYITEAEKFGNAAVFDMDKKTWYLQDGATWQFPFGADGETAKEDHPVTQVSWNDAQAYCKWAGKRLPTEFEFEYAASWKGNGNQTYNWGNALVENDRYMANTWQGHFPEVNLAKDGYLFTSPAGAFGSNSAGFADLGGNVWEWTNSWYQPYSNILSGINDSSAGLRTIKGGSFLCDTAFCCGYRISARTGTSPETSLFHTGFRCALSAN